MREPLTSAPVPRTATGSRDRHQQRGCSAHGRRKSPPPRRSTATRPAAREHVGSCGVRTPHGLAQLKRARELHKNTSRTGAPREHRGSRTHDISDKDLRIHQTLVERRQAYLPWVDWQPPSHLPPQAVVDGLVDEIVRPFVDHAVTTGLVASPPVGGLHLRFTTQPPVPISIRGTPPLSLRTGHCRRPSGGAYRAFSVSPYGAAMGVPRLPVSSQPFPGHPPANLARPPPRPRRFALRASRLAPVARRSCV